MKKIFAMAISACILASCAGNGTEGTTTTDSMAMEMEPAADNTGVYTPAEGDVTYRGGRVQVYHDNDWEDANDDVRLDNGVVVYRRGWVVRDNDEYVWEEGYVVDRRGNVWDRTGNAISDAWDATKHGVKKAGQAVGHAAERVGEKTKDVVDGKDDNENN